MANQEKSNIKETGIIGECIPVPTCFKTVLKGTGIHYNNSY